MLVHSVSLPLARSLAADYRSGEPQAVQFFRYLPHDPASVSRRLGWLRTQRYPHRNELADGLARYNQGLGCHPAVLANIEKLRHEDTYVVIGGQQAGLLTGPLYTVYKAVHVIQEAKHLEEELGVQIVPVFWIAGEDHDLAEIDHVYLPLHETGTVRKEIPLAGRRRTSASMLPVDPAEMERFVEAFFAGQPETPHTAELRALLTEEASRSNTLVDWFARVMTRLFGRYGLVLVESSLPFVRRLEAPLFRELIRNADEISALLAESERRLAAAGYDPQLNLEPAQVHLFLYEGGERVAIYREQDRFVLKGSGSTYTRDQLLALAEEAPHRFSANVVSRPLAQERLFPTLAFVGGPGEVAYWAYFDAAFRRLGMQLPIVLPRLTVTLVEGAVERTLRQLDLAAETVLTDFSRWKADWEARVKPVSLAARFEQTRESIRRLYAPLVEEVAAVDKGLRPLAEENLRRLLSQVDFLEARTGQAALARHDQTRRRIARVEAALLPRGQWQERVYNVFTYLNRHGLDLIDRLVQAPLARDGRHNLVYL